MILSSRGKVESSAKCVPNMLVLAGFCFLPIDFYAARLGISAIERYGSGSVMYLVELQSFNFNQQNTRFYRYRKKNFLNAVLLLQHRLNLVCNARGSLYRTQIIFNIRYAFLYHHFSKLLFHFHLTTTFYSRRCNTRYRQIRMPNISLHSGWFLKSYIANPWPYVWDGKIHWADS